MAKCNPWYITGFVDGEGSFHVAIYKDPRMKHGVKIIPEFHISQRRSSKGILEEIAAHFYCGYVKANHAANPRDATYVFVVRNRHDLLKKVIPFFTKYRLRTEKQRDFARFAQVVRLMADGKHEKKAGIQHILKLAYAMNGGGKYRRSIVHI